MITILIHSMFYIILYRFPSPLWIIGWCTATSGPTSSFFGACLPSANETTCDTKWNQCNGIVFQIKYLILNLNWYIYNLVLILSYLLSTLLLSFPLQNPIACSCTAEIAMVSVIGISRLIYLSIYLFR